MFFYHMKKVLSEQQCAELIAKGNALGFNKAQVNHYGKMENLNHIRNNERVEWDEPNLSQELNQLLKDKLGDDFPQLIQEMTYAEMGSHFRMYKYSPQEYFKPHKDGGYKKDQLVSLITVLFYLNDTDGGETVLMPDGYQHKENHIVINPKAGDVLLFEHQFWHEGKSVKTGEKFVLRTDLFFEPLKAV